jgi:D-amino-acid dehydrogenase
MKHVVVIGGGVVGLTTAWSLVESGCAVSLVERAAQLALGASYANGGQLSYRFVSPLADEGVPAKALRWLFEPDAPLRFKPDGSLHQWAWLASFLSNCRGSVNQRTTQRLLALGAFSQASFAELVASAHLDATSLRTPGKLVIYRSAAEFGKVVRRLRKGKDALEQVLTAPECLSLEPALAHSPLKLSGGVFTAGEAVADCYAMSIQLGARLEAHSLFRGVIQAEALGFRTEAGIACALRTSAGELQADDFVIAAGLQSRVLAHSVGISLPLYPLKGYSLTAPIRAGHTPPRVSVTDIEKKVLYAQIGSDLRVAAMADMVGEDTRIDPQRMASLHRLVRTTFPAAAAYDQATEWAGLRPATPTGAPILGATPIPGVWLNVGHGALGFTLSFGSARILAALIAGEPSPLPLDGLRLQ